MIRLPLFCGNDFDIAAWCLTSILARERVHVFSVVLAESDAGWQAVAARRRRFPDEVPYDYMGLTEEWHGFGPEQQNLFANCYIGL